MLFSSIWLRLGFLVLWVTMRAVTALTLSSEVAFVWLAARNTLEIANTSELVDRIALNSPRSSLVTRITLDFAGSSY